MGIAYIDDLGPLMAPQYLTAQTPKGLRRAMLKNNIRLKAHVHYYHIQYIESESRWYAWFYEKPSETKSIDAMVTDGGID